MSLAGAAARDPRAEPKNAFSYRHVVSFEDTNVMGNVYFVRHIAWQGRCRELFLKEHAPSVLDEIGKGLRLVTLHVSCDYFEELRPFDELDVRMSLAQRSGHRLRLAFEYVTRRDGQEILAARGAHEIGCMKQAAAGLVPCEPPAALLAALRPFE
jgi:enediyne biosynthesis thioesterase